jgi:NADH-quinone oxidoreductase E subunit
MAHLAPDVVSKAREVVALYPHPRSALIPLCHLAQAQDGWLTPEAIVEIAELVGCTAAEVEGTASFYDMLHTERVGKYVVTVCTNIACMLAGSYELLEHAEERLGVRAGATTSDGLFTLEEAECLAACDVAPCLQVNSRFFGSLTDESFDQLVEDLAAGKHDDEVPRFGVLCRYERRHGLEAGGGRAGGGAATAVQVPSGQGKSAAASTSDSLSGERDRSGKGGSPGGAGDAAKSRKRGGH